MIKHAGIIYFCQWCWRWRYISVDTETTADIKANVHKFTLKFVSICLISIDHFRRNGSTFSSGVIEMDSGAIYI